MNWYIPSGENISFEEILKMTISHSKNEGTIHVGTDSQLISDKYVFSTAICLIGGHGKTKNNYFISKSNVNAKKYPNLLQRIMEEAQKSINIGFKILEFCPTIDIELHLDVSGEEKNESTSKFSKMLQGIVLGSGFDCKIKPEAFAASTVADRHTKSIRKGIEK